VQIAEGYVEWRRDFWLKRDERPKNCAVNPSKKTLQIEFRLLTQALKWASREKLMRPLEAMKAPTVSTDPDRLRRHGFSSNEWLDLAYYMESWQHSGRHRLHNTQRALLRRLIWCYYLTGLRRREMETLTWKSIVPYGDGTRAELTVAADTKTGTRTVISQPDIFKYLPERGEKDDLVWPEGWEPHVSLRKLLTDAGLIKGPDGFNRTIYSFRHTYATERLTAGATYEDLALNMGTSYKNIRKHYSHVLPRDRADKLTRLDGYSAAEIVNATNWLRQTARGNGLDWEALVQQALLAKAGSVENAAPIGSTNAAQRAQAPILPRQAQTNASCVLGCPHTRTTPLPFRCSDNPMLTISEEQRRVMIDTNAKMPSNSPNIWRQHGAVKFAGQFRKAVGMASADWETYQRLYGFWLARWLV
jgi:integrase